MKGLRLLAIIFVLPLLATAQVVPATPSIGVKLNVGLKLGVNFAKLNGTDWDGGYKTNLLGGAYVNLHGNRLGIQVEGLFSQSTYTTGSDFGTIYNQYLSNAGDSLKQGTFRVSYFNIPILLQVKFMPRVWIQLGPQYSGVVSTQDKDKFVKDAGELFKSGTISGVGGLWLNLTSHLNVGARYVFSFTDENNTEAKMADAWKSRNIQVHLGYTF